MRKNVAGKPLASTLGNTACKVVMCRKQRQSPEIAAHDRSSMVEGLPAQLVEAHENVCQALENAGVLPARSESFRLGRTTQRVAEVPQGTRLCVFFGLASAFVKQYRVPSPNQEAVLTVFQEEGWPPRIDDPLSPVPDGFP